jgi:hypothetical protein
MRPIACEADHFEHTGWVTQTPSMMDNTGLDNMASSLTWG